MKSISVSSVVQTPRFWRSQSGRSIVGLALATATFALCPLSVRAQWVNGVGGQQHGPIYDVLWFPRQSANVPPIYDRVSAGDRIKFYWTEVGNPHPYYTPFEYTPKKGTIFAFDRPDDRSITDWSQEITPAHGGPSHVTTGNINHNSPWAYYPLEDLPLTPYDIPDFAVFSGDTTITIYEAVNLGEYMRENPMGPLKGNYQIGQTLDELGLTIVNGQIPGIKGLYFSTAPFNFDPDSTYGYIPSGGEANWLNSATFGGGFGATNVNTLGLVGIHNGNVPEPGAIAFGVLAAGSVIGLIARKRKA